MVRSERLQLIRNAADGPTPHSELAVIDNSAHINNLCSVLDITITTAENCQQFGTLVSALTVLTDNFENATKINMRCCVQNCLNDDLKKTNKSNEITFHKLPKDPVHCSVWLRVLARADCRLSKRVVVCSDHFLPEDFDDTRPNQRRVKSGAVPTLVCRVCLSLDVKMYDMKDFKLTDMFQNVTGISVCDKKERILHRICWECRARLTAAVAFRDKALFSDALLKDLVNIKHSDIALFKQKHSSLKSPLTVQTVFTSNDIGCDDTVFENKKLEISLNDNTDINKRKTELRIIEEDKEKEFEQDEPCIDFPVKTEIESEPIAENNINHKSEKSYTSLKPTHFNDTFTSNEYSEEDEIGNTEVLMNKIDDKDFSENTEMTNVPIVKDGVSIVLVEDKEKDVKIGDDSPSKDDTETSVTAKDLSVNKSKQKISSKVGASNKKKRLTGRIKEKIIALQKKGLSVRAIAKEIGFSVESVDRWWSYYRKNCKTNRSSTTVETEQSDAKQDYCYTAAEPGKEMGACSAIVRQRLQEAGLEHILMKKPERNGNMEQIKTSTDTALHDDFKQRIISLKQEGMTETRIAYLLDTCRVTVHKWWTRWCNEGHTKNGKRTGRKRKTTPEEDQLLIDRVTQEQTVITSSLAMKLGISPKSVRRRLVAAGFKHKRRIAYVPLKLGRRQKIDEEVKQQIMTLKLNGVSVTDIANQFRVPRTTIYRWSQRMCKENKIKITSDNNTNTTTEQEHSLAEDTNVENIVQTPTKKSQRQKLPDVELVP